MNIDTGEIRDLSDVPEEEYERWIPIDKAQMNHKQMIEMQVSKYDNRSKLGKVFTGNRASRRRQEKEYRKELRKTKNPKPTEEISDES